MHFSVLHISDLHRDLAEEVNNTWLLESLVRDFEQYGKQDPIIMKPTLCIVSGDLVFGVNPNKERATAELERQYAQAEEFLIGLADQFFNGDREKVVILPGNHDVSYYDVMESVQRVNIPPEPENKLKLVAELFVSNSLLRWSWNDLCFFRITDNTRYNSRFHHFANTYERFYEGRRTFSLISEDQYGIFDFADLGFCVITLNSCYNNDPLRRAGAFHPDTIAKTCRALRDTKRIGWLIAGAWHHNLSGSPAKDNYLDIELLQPLIDAGVSLGFHGHHHLTDCVDEHYRIGPIKRKITTVSASSLCAGWRYLSPGIPRSYNIIELCTDTWRGRVHQRQMVNQLFSVPVWGPGHFNATNLSYFDFDICKPLMIRPAKLDEQLILDQADRLLGSRQWKEALDILRRVKDVPLARPLLVKALTELGDMRLTITLLWPPLTNSEAVMIGGAILDSGTPEEAKAFLQLEFISNSKDASVRDIVNRICERRIR